MNSRVTKKQLIEQWAEYGKEFLQRAKSADEIIDILKKDGEDIFNIQTAGRVNPFDELNAGRLGVNNFNNSIKKIFQRQLSQNVALFDDAGKLTSNVAKTYSKAIAYNDVINVLEKNKNYLNSLIEANRMDEATLFIDNTITKAVSRQKTALADLAQELGAAKEANLAKEAAIPAKVGEDSAKGKFSNVLKNIIKRKAIGAGIGLVVGGIGLYWLYNKFFKGQPYNENNLKTYAQKLSVFTQKRPCMKNILDDNGITLDIDSKNYLIIKMPHTGVPEYDAVGGLGFYDFGVVYKINQPKALGNYSCNATTISEQDTSNNDNTQGTDNTQNTDSTPNSNTTSIGDGNPNTGLSGITIKWLTDENGKTLGTASGISKFTVCYGKPLPHPIGCRSNEIGTVQSCLPNITPNSILDDNTVRALQDMGYNMASGLTEDIYNSVMDKCGKPHYVSPAQKATEEANAPQVNGSKLYNMLVSRGLLTGTDSSLSTMYIKNSAPTLNNAQLTALNGQMSLRGYNMVQNNQLPPNAKYAWQKQ